MNALLCPGSPFGHDWDNGLVCRLCSATRTAAEAIVSGLASRRGGDPESARVLLAARDADVIRTAVDSVSAAHADCHRDRDVCAGCQVRADILDVLAGVADVIGEKATAPAATATPFFQIGHTYTEPSGVTDWKFRVDTATTHPEDGERTALGWRRFRGEWEPYAYGEDDWEIHQLADITTTTSKDSQ